MLARPKGRQRPSHPLEISQPWTSCPRKTINGSSTQPSRRISATSTTGLWALASGAPFPCLLMLSRLRKEGDVACTRIHGVALRPLARVVRVKSLLETSRGRPLAFGIDFSRYVHVFNYVAWAFFVFIHVLGIRWSEAALGKLWSARQHRCSWWEHELTRIFF